jgi:hypothetical protein
VPRRSHYLCLNHCHSSAPATLPRRNRLSAFTATSTDQFTVQQVNCVRSHPNPTNLRLPVLVAAEPRVTKWPVGHDDVVLSFITTHMDCRRTAACGATI